MCGIAGIIGRPVEEDVFKKVISSLSHRGPDDQGIWTSNQTNVTLGHRRLTILDLSERGNQPMLNSNGNLIITFNGEIFNFKDIRNELQSLGYSFRSTSDTEVLLYAYQEWQEEMLYKLRGQFAFALWDEEKKELFAARDRVGIKPLIYLHRNNMFAFASEIKALLQIDNFKFTTDWSALYDYLTYMYVPAPKTKYNEIRKLEAGHYLKFSGSTLTIKQYWDVNPEEILYFDEKKAHRKLEELIEESVQLRLIADVPISIFLSGGLDSSAIASFAAIQKKEPINTFSIGFDQSEYTETHFARMVSDKYHTNQIEKTFTLDSANDIKNSTLLFYDEPISDSSTLPVYFLCKIVSEEFKVALSGSGGDEIFNGYRWFDAFDRVSNSTIRKVFKYSGASSLLQKAVLNYRGFATRHFISDELELYAHIKGGFIKAEKKAILHPDLLEEFKDYDDYWYFRKYWKSSLSNTSRVQYIDFKTYLPENILTILDRSGMRNSLEARVPLLDHKIVEHAFATSPEIRRYGKSLLIGAVRDYLPKQIIDRDKKGFSAPFHLWYADDQLNLPNSFPFNQNITPEKYSTWKRHQLYVLSLFSNE